MYQILLLFLTLVFSFSIFAQPELDPTFAGSGKSAFVFGANGAPSDLIVQSDNKIVMVSPCFNINLGPRPFCVIRVNENGGIDSAFRSSQLTLGAYSSVGTESSGVAIQNDGKIIAVGYLANGSNENLVLTRWDSTGSLDTSFGSSGNGTVIFTVPPDTTNRAKKVLVQPDGKILIVGRSSSSLFVARILTGGTLDPTFGVGGVATLPNAGSATTGLSIALQGDGKIFAGGRSTSAYLLARFNADGTPDNTWDGDGIKTIGSSGTAEDNGFRSIALQADGRVVALGHSNLLYRFNSDGTLDMTFDGDGSRQALNSPFLCDPWKVVVSPGGLITVVGERTALFSQSGGTFDYLTARYTSNGSPDPTYSGDGYLDIDIQNNDGGRAAGIDTFGRIAFGGRSGLGTVNFPYENSGFSGARLLASPGANVGISGRVTTSSGRGIYKARVQLTGGGGIRSAITNSFGYYRFVNVAAGQVYAVEPASKQFEFTSQNVFVGDNVSANFTALE